MFLKLIIVDVQIGTIAKTRPIANALFIF